MPHNQINLVMAIYFLFGSCSSQSIHFHHHPEW